MLCRSSRSCEGGCELACLRGIYVGTAGGAALEGVRALARMAHQVPRSGEKKVRFGGGVVEQQLLLKSPNEAAQRLGLVLNPQIGDGAARDAIQQLLLRQFAQQSSGQVLSINQASFSDESRSDHLYRAQELLLNRRLESEMHRAQSSYHDVRRWLTKLDAEPNPQRR